MIINNKNILENNKDKFRFDKIVFLELRRLNSFENGIYEVHLVVIFNNLVSIVIVFSLNKQISLDIQTRIVYFLGKNKNSNQIDLF